MQKTQGAIFPALFSVAFFGMVFGTMARFG